ncbi:(2Fe-2S)-binding protein [Pandoraea terrigena]|uniref:Hydrogen cyanide synthase subunit HcnA n=1 Tax=Pandoraea terrigena TaxID=2508292 RepID=A0A5E4XZK3_9BURK|nr:(2Fe-2S)-binding protein [Pandoraea terrigena]VVE41889.1 Hydrogen cyanide synthase subunit HcnA [Pandoraea terrigena]
MTTTRDKPQHPPHARFVRVAETGRAPVSLRVDARPVQAFEGDTVMVAILTAQGALRDAEFGPERRAGFCVMGACQDCWVWTRTGQRLRACTTPAAAGMDIVTRLVRSNDDATAPMRASTGGEEALWPLA